MTSPDPDGALKGAYDAKNCPFYPGCYIAGDCPLNGWKDSKCGLPRESTAARSPSLHGPTIEACAKVAIRKLTDALTRHHQWHAAQTTPDLEYGYVPADEYADSSMYEQTVEALAVASPLLSDGPVNTAALSPIPETPREGVRCEMCGGPYGDKWAAPSPLWNAVMRGGSINGEWIGGELVCPCCFIKRAEKLGIATGWRLSADDVSVPLETVTPSGRVWNDKTQMWEQPTSPEPAKSAGGEVERLVRAAYEDRPITAMSQGLSDATGVPVGEPISYDKAVAAGCDMAGLRRIVTAVVAALSQPRDALVEVREVLDDLQHAEAEYRMMHDRHGGGSRAAGRAWDLMRRAGNRARAALAKLAPASPHQGEGS